MKLFKTFNKIETKFNKIINRVEIFPNFSGFRNSKFVMFLLKKFLGCFELETGALVIGWFNLIRSLYISVHAPSSIFNDEVNSEFSISFFIFHFFWTIVNYVLIRGVKTVSKMPQTTFKRSLLQIYVTKTSAQNKFWFQRNASLTKIALNCYVISWILALIQIAGSSIWEMIIVFIIEPYILLTLYSMKVKLFDSTSNCRWFINSEWEKKEWEISCDLKIVYKFSKWS